MQSGCRKTSEGRGGFPQIKELFDDYILSKKTEAEMYNSTSTNIGLKNIATTVGKAKDSLYRNMGNEILKAIKLYNMEKRIALREERERHREKVQEEIKEQQMERLFLAVLRMLKNFSQQGQASVSASAKNVFGKGGDMSRAEVLELLYKHRDKGEHER